MTLPDMAFGQRDRIVVGEHRLHHQGIAGDFRDIDIRKQSIDVAVA